MYSLRYVVNYIGWLYCEGTFNYLSVIRKLGYFVRLSNKNVFCLNTALDFYSFLTSKFLILWYYLCMSSSGNVGITYLETK